MKLGPQQFARFPAELVGDILVRQVQFDGATHATQCPFCATPVVSDTGTHRHIKPQALVPFQLDEKTARNALIQEGVRAFYTGWYKELVTELPIVRNGMVTVGAAPGLGLELLPDLQKREDAVVRNSRL